MGNPEYERLEWDIESDIDSYYDFNYIRDWQNPIYLRAAKAIDNAEPVDLSSDPVRFNTPFGNCISRNFSTGCKALLLLLENLDEDTILDFSEVGPNVWEYLFTYHGDIKRKIFSNTRNMKILPQSGIYLNDTFFSHDQFKEFQDKAREVLSYE